MSRRKLNSLGKFESLEARRMMAGDISFNDDNGVLTITGAGLDDVAEVRFVEDKVEVDLYSQELDDGEIEIDHSDLDGDDAPDIADVTKIVFNGFGGDDTLTINVGQLDQGESVNNVVLEFNGGANDDELIQNGGGIKTTALGEGGNDRLEGSRFNDVLNGGADNDTYVYRGRAVGSDEIREVANAGRDTLDFTNFDTFVNVNLATVFTASNPQFMATAFQSNLQLKQFNSTGIEDVIGSAFTDTIRGNARSNHLMGMGDADKLSGLGGDDTLEGGVGNDTYEFAGNNLGTDDIVEAASVDTDTLRFGGMSYGLTIDLNKSGNDLAVDSTNLKVRLSNSTAIENVFGTDFVDTIIGNSRNNRLLGLGSGDTIRGNGGADTIEGGEGSDRLFTDALDQVYGGLGRDIFDNLIERAELANPRPTRYLDWATI
jgi:Ca2+-binding RTX toxin-like protein